MLNMATEEDIRRRAQAVTGTPHVAASMSALQAARCLLGIVNIMAEIYGTNRMQAACFTLAKFDASWFTRFRVLPSDNNGQTLEPERFLAHASRGILLTAGADNLRSAMSFWAVERDAAVFQQVAAGVSIA